MRNVGSGHSAASVVLVGLTSDDVGKVRECLAAEALLPAGSVGYGDALSAVARTRPDVVIVGFSANTEAPLALAQELQQQDPNTVLVGLSTESNAEHILAAMRVGYREFVVLPKDSQRLRKVVHDSAYASTGDDDQRAVVVAFLGAKGGVGSTMLATHLATELAGIHRVLIIDMDFSMGDVASLLDLTPKDHLTGLLSRASRIDERMLRGAITVHSTKVHVLSQPGELDASVEVRSDDIYSVIAAAAKVYQYIIVDCGVYVDEGVATAIHVADIVALVTEPSVVSVRNAFRRVQLLRTLEVEEDRIRLVVNRHSRGAYVSVGAIEQNLGISVAGTISDDPRTVDQAINEGKLVREVDRKSEVAGDISRLVAVLTQEVEDEPQSEDAAPSSGGFLFGLFNRRGR